MYACAWVCACACMCGRVWVRWGIMAWNGGLASSVYCLVASLFRNVYECAEKGNARLEHLMYFIHRKTLTCVITLAQGL